MRVVPVAGSVRSGRSLIPRAMHSLLLPIDPAQECLMNSVAQPERSMLIIPSVGVKLLPLNVFRRRLQLIRSAPDALDYPLIATSRVRTLRELLRPKHTLFAISASNWS